MNKYQIIKYIPYSILIISVLSLNPYFIYPIGNTTTTWILELFVLYLFYAIKPYLNLKGYKNEMNIISLYLFYIIFSFFRGFFIAETYWDYKALFSNGLALLIPVVAFSVTSPIFLKILTQFYLKYTLPLFIVFFFMIPNGAVGFYLVPFSFLALFLPVIHKPWNWLVFLICIFVSFIELGARSNVIKFIFPVLLSFIYYLRFYINIKFLEHLRKGLFMLPLLLFVLAIYGDFNVFKINEYVEGDYKVARTDATTGEKIKEDLTSDTRSPLYLEVLNTAKKYNSWLIGRSPARGNETELFASIAEITGRQERAGNEVAILNIFTWIGIVGVLFNFIIYYKASYLSLNFSNNIFSKILGLFIGFRWCYAWVEDINYFTLTTFFLWLMIGMCFSESFRQMTDVEMKYWVCGIFKKQRRIKRKRTLQSME